MPEPTRRLAARLDTAARHATTAVPTAEPGDRLDAVLASMRGRRYDSASVIAVCSDGRLVGLVTIGRLLAAPADATIEAVMDPDPPVVAPGADQEHAAWTAVQHGEPGLAVVDSDGGFHGLIPPQRLLGVLLAEHHEDLARSAVSCVPPPPPGGASVESGCAHSHALR